MKLRYPVLVLVLIILTYSCIAGCTGYRGNYARTTTPAAPDITPGVSPLPAAPPRIPSTAISFSTHFSFMNLGENAAGLGETNLVQK